MPCKEAAARHIAALVRKKTPDRGTAKSVIPMDRILADLSKLDALLAKEDAAAPSGLTRNMVLISGPRELHIFVDRS